MTGRFTPETLPNNITSKFAHGLTKIDENSNIKADIAESWQISEDGKTWTFKLFDNKYWNDGEKITSKTINLNFGGVTLTRPDDFILKFTLNEVFVPFPSLLSKPIYKKGLIGSGEWNAERIIFSNNVIRELVLKNKGGEIIYKFYPTEEKTKTSFILGKIDKIERAFNPLPFNSWETTDVIREVDKQQVVTLFFNVKDPLLSDKDLRQALNYSIDKSTFNDQRAYTSIQPQSWAFNPQVKPYNYDIDRAKEQINSLPAEIKNNLKINLISSPNLIDLAENIKHDWTRIGIDTTIAVSSVPPSDYQSYLAVFDIPDDPDQYIYWHSTQDENNWSKYSNPRIDKLLEDGRKQYNIEDRKKIYLDFQRYLAEDVPAIFLYHPVWYSITRK